MIKNMEREPGLEPATSSLGKRYLFVSCGVWCFLARPEVYAVSPVSTKWSRMESQRSHGFATLRDCDGFPYARGAGKGS